jgi:hypothetical protein
MKIIKIIVNIIWGIIAFFWVITTLTNVSSSVKFAQSAVQASQLYNEGTMTILAIIAITLLIYLGDIAFVDPTESIQQQLNNLTEYSKHMSEILTRHEQQMGGATTSASVFPQKTGNVENLNAIPFSNLSKSGTAPLIQQQTPQEKTGFRYCPKCKSLMNIKTATKGENKGKQYYVCSKYPTCSEVIPI